MTDVTKSDIAAFIAAFCARYKALRKASYFVRRPKDLTLVRLLLETYPHEELVLMAEDLLTTEDEWVAGTDRGIGILTVKASWLANRRAQREVARPVKEYWGDTCQREHASACRSRWEHEMKMREAV